MCSLVSRMQVTYWRAPRWFDCTDKGQHGPTALGSASSTDGTPPYLWTATHRGDALTSGVHVEASPEYRTVHIR
jgi:hypothetical protein